MFLALSLTHTKHLINAGFIHLLCLIHYYTTILLHILQQNALRCKGLLTGFTHKILHSLIR